MLTVIDRNMGHRDTPLCGNLNLARVESNFFLSVSIPFREREDEN